MTNKIDMKIVLLGKEYGGKTSLVERYLHDRFSGDIPYQNTIGAAFGAKRIETCQRKYVMLGIWDTAGSERYEAMSRIYYRGAKAAIICFDLTEKNSFEKAKFWVKELNKSEENCKVYLCGTKNDLVKGEALKGNRGVDYYTVTDYADEINGQVFETSSKTGENIYELFRKIADDYVNDPANQEPKPSARDKLNLEEPSTPTKKLHGGCCS
ncbi:ras-related protein Rab-24-like [Lineus longissimus]|uniref:ras-related protein Rab-24-like n=1 Tax=Lineus longissimus TaxID=88925 RepID=UPI002B4E8A41